MPDPVFPDARLARGMIGGSKGPGPGAFSGSGSIGGEVEVRSWNSCQALAAGSRIGPLHRGREDSVPVTKHPIDHHDNIQSTGWSGFEAQHPISHDTIRPV